MKGIEMSNAYSPDRWVILKISSPKGIHHRIFGTWNESFASGSEWRLNSGIERCSKNVDKEFPSIYYADGHSGSQYVLYGDGYGICGGWEHQIPNLVASGLMASPMITVSQLTETEAVEYLNKLSDDANAVSASQEKWVNENF